MLVLLHHEFQQVENLPLKLNSEEAYFFADNHIKRRLSRGVSKPKSLHRENVAPQIGSLEPLKVVLWLPFRIAIVIQLKVDDTPFDR